MDNNIVYEYVLRKSKHTPSGNKLNTVVQLVFKIHSKIQKSKKHVLNSNLQSKAHQCPCELKKEETKTQGY